MKIITRMSERTGVGLNSVILPIFVLVVLAATAENFISWENISNLSNQMAALLIVSLGQLLVVLIAGLDLSVGSVISLTTCIMALDWSLWVSIPVALGMGVIIGSINGLGVAVAGIHPIVMTLSTMTFLQGAIFQLQSIPGGDVAESLLSAGAGYTIGLPNSFFWWTIALIIAYLMVHRLRFGLHLYAVGNNPNSARLNGVGVAKVTMAAYIFCSLFAVIAGIFLAARVASGDPLIGEPYSLQSITAVALGGAHLSGGVGGVAVVLIGSISLGLISNGMNLLGISPFLQSSLIGLLLILVVCFQRRKFVGL